MRTFKSNKCPVCGKMYRNENGSLAAFETHLRKEHPGTIPEGWTILHYVYFLHTGKTAGSCRVCKEPTEWNESTGCYARICKKPECKKIFRAEFLENCRKAGKEDFMNDPKHREKMLVNRRISGLYRFQDGGEVAYMGKLEKGFLQMLDTFFRFPSSDIMGPSPNRYVYWYDNPNDPDHVGEHIYIPDFYIPSANLEIEIKSATNERPSNLTIDVVRDAFKDVRMIRDPMVNYIKLYEEDYHVFFQVFADLAEQNRTGEKRLIKYISRAILTSIYRRYIPSDCMKILEKYIYKYSSSSVLPASKAIESESIDNIELNALEEPEEDTTPSDFDITAEYLGENAPTHDENDGDEDAPITPEDMILSINPFTYYDIPESAATESLSVFDAENFTMNDICRDAAMEALGGKKPDKKVIDTKTVAGRAATENRSWKEKLFGNSKVAAKVFTKVTTTTNGNILIQGINCNLLLYRIKEKYEESRLKYIFEYNYNSKSWKAFQKKKISRGEMKIDSVQAPAFFALELVTLFNDLAKEYRDNSYRRIAELIYENSWLSTADKIQVPDVSLEPLKNLTLELLPYQKEFIRLWDKLKSQLNTNGYILSFKPGKGKTLTAIGLAECLKAKKVYVICPNALKENWALEIKKYYEKYQKDESLWHNDVAIVGASNSAPPNLARFVICNNEALGKLSKMIYQADPDCLIIIDESHNFANYNGTRSQELFKIADTLQSKNVLCMSATPIKAVPAEIGPALRVIDPTFTDEAAKMFTRCFELNNAAAMIIIERRFGKIIYRPEDAEVPLPEKHEETLYISIPNESRYYLTTVHDEIIQVFKDLHEAWLKSNKSEVNEFESLIYRYSMASRRDSSSYIGWVMNSSNSLKGVNDGAYHELSIDEYKRFIDEYIRPNTNCPNSVLNDIVKKEKYFVTAAKSHMGTAIGGIIHDRRAEMFIAMYDAAKDKIYEQIRNRSKKTIIFSTMVPVVNYIAEDLNKFGINSVLITGATPNRLTTLTHFKENPNVLALVATSQTLGTGLTLTEASQMFFFGTPWRSINYEQAADRIWRIGQTDEVNVWTAVMKSAKPNLSTRMQDILEWSDRMFNAAVAPTQLSEEFVAATEAESLLDNQTKTIITLYNEIKDFAYGCEVDGKIVNPETDEEFEKIYRTLTTSAFKRLKGGVCWDYVAYQSEWLRKHGLSSFNYYIDYGAWDTPSHTITVIPSATGCFYIEASFKMIRGVYTANSLDDVLNFVIDKMKQFNPHGVDVDKVRVFRIPMVKPLSGLNIVEYVAAVTKNNPQIKFKKNPRNSTTRIQTDMTAMESFAGFKPKLDSHQYLPIDDPTYIREMEKMYTALYPAMDRAIPAENIDIQNRLPSTHNLMNETGGIDAFAAVLKVHLALNELGINNSVKLLACPDVGFLKLACIAWLHDGDNPIDGDELFLVNPCDTRPNKEHHYYARTGVFYTERGIDHIATSLLVQHVRDYRKGPNIGELRKMEYRWFNVPHSIIVKATANEWSNREFIQTVVTNFNSSSVHFVDSDLELHKVEVLNYGILLSRY